MSKMNLCQWIQSLVSLFHKQTHSQSKQQNEDIFQFHLKICTHSNEQEPIQWLKRVSFIASPLKTKRHNDYPEEQDLTLFEGYVFEQLLSEKTFLSTFQFLSEFLLHLHFQSQQKKQKQKDLFCSHFLQFIFREYDVLLQHCQKKKLNLSFVRVFCFLLRQTHPSNPPFSFHSQLELLIQRELGKSETTAEQRYEILLAYLEWFIWVHSTEMSNEFPFSFSFVCESCVVISEFLIRHPSKHSPTAQICVLEAISVLLTQKEKEKEKREQHLLDMLAICFHSICREDRPVESQEVVLSFQNMNLCFHKLSRLLSSKSNQQDIWKEVDPNGWWIHRFPEIFYFHRLHGFQPEELAQCQMNILQLISSLCPVALWEEPILLFLIRSIFLSSSVSIPLDTFKMFKNQEHLPIPFESFPRFSLMTFCIQKIEKICVREKEKGLPLEKKQKKLRQLFCLIYQHQTLEEQDGDEDEDDQEETLESRECTYLFVCDCAMILSRTFEEKRYTELCHLIYFVTIILLSVKVDNFSFYLHEAYDIESIQRIYLFLKFVCEKILRFAELQLKEQVIVESCPNAASLLVPTEWDEKKQEISKILVSSHNLLKHCLNVLADFNREEKSISQSRSNSLMLTCDP